MLRVESGEHVRLIFLRVGAAVQQQPATVLVDAGVVTGREPVAACSPGEREQLGEAKGAVAADAWVRRLAARVPADERRHDRAAELLAQIERHMRQPEPMARLTCCDHRLGGTAGALRIGAFRVEPEAKRHADRLRCGAQERNRAVDASAHRDCGPPRARLGAEDRPERVRERVARKGVAADRGRFEQGQPLERTLEPGRIRLDDAIVVDEQANRRPFAAARRVSEGLDHGPTVARRGAEAPLRVSTLPM